MKQLECSSWGRYPSSKRFNQEVHSLSNRDDINLETLNKKQLLSFGNGRSYGDSCLNDEGILLKTRGLDRFIKFDSKKGVLRCEAGVLLSEIIELIVPYGWFLTVTPGTRFVTVGGAIANDVHGKNHHRVGTFGCSVTCFELLRSDGKRLFCSNDENSEFFSATIGGLGLTGIILWAEISLQKINSAFLDVETLCFDNLSGFFDLSVESDTDYEHTVAWVDCLAAGDDLGRGVFMRANYKNDDVDRECSIKNFSFPIDPPFSLVNKFSLKIFNNLYRWSNCKNQGDSEQYFQQFFYPLDSIQNWNRIYGNKGFLQYQCVIPEMKAQDIIGKILMKISHTGLGSFLAVLKNFGNIKSPGMLSFPRAGTTLALDFPNHGKKLLELLNELDKLVVSAGGAIYPAKDARMSSHVFKSSFPNWLEFSKFIDSGFSSSFWRRVTKDKENMI